MREYEMMVIVNPELSDQDIDGTITSIKENLEQIGEIKEVEEWGRRKLAYPIGHAEEGAYYLLTFNANPEGIDGIKKFFSLKKKEVMRYMVIRR